MLTVLGTQPEVDVTIVHDIHAFAYPADTPEFPWHTMKIPVIGRGGAAGGRTVLVAYLSDKSPRLIPPVKIADAIKPPEATVIMRLHCEQAYTHASHWQAIAQNPGRAARAWVLAAGFGHTQDTWSWLLTTGCKGRNSLSRIQGLIRIHARDVNGSSRSAAQCMREPASSPRPSTGM